jgi:hypothetical protein
LATTGNWREINKVDEHNVIYVKTKAPMDPQVAKLMTATIILAIVSFVAVIGCFFFGIKSSKATPSKESEMMKVNPENEGGMTEGGHAVLPQNSQ